MREDNCGGGQQTVARALIRFCGVAAVVGLALFAGNVEKSHAALVTGGYCPGATQAFSQWGDPHYYVFGQNGGLESGSYGWSLAGGSAVVSGNESYYLHSRYDTHSLFLPADGSATTPTMCMETSSSVLRFFMKGGGAVHVQVIERNLLGLVVGVLDQATVGGSATWQPSPTIVNLQSLQGVVGVSSVQLRFTAQGGSDQIDDVYVDPMASSN
jgi:hypothetical protein